MKIISRINSIESGIQDMKIGKVTETSEVLVNGKEIPRILVTFENQNGDSISQAILAAIDNKLCRKLFQIIVGKDEEKWDTKKLINKKCTVKIDEVESQSGKYLNVVDILNNDEDYEDDEDDEDEDYEDEDYEDDEDDSLNLENNSCTQNIQLNRNYRR